MARARARHRHHKCIERRWMRMHICMHRFGERICSFREKENWKLLVKIPCTSMCWDVQKPARQCAMLGYGWRIGSRHAAHIVTEIKLRFNLRGRALALARAHTEMAHGFTNQLMMNTKAHNVINSFCRRLSRQLIGIPHTHTHTRDSLPDLISCISPTRPTYHIESSRAAQL